jgi:uncharacterized protein
MDCPKCNSIMEDVTVEDITVKRCTQCQGIWFTEAEHKAMKKVKGSEKIDAGSAAKGKEFDSITNVPCPVCNLVMDRIADSFQPHIHYETCSRGHGVFFDSGEYKDFKEETLSDFFKSLNMWMKRKK